MRIAISGITGFRNRGVEALTLPIVRECRARFGAETAVSLVSRDAGFDAHRIERDGIDVEVLPDRIGARGRIDGALIGLSKAVPRLAPGAARLRDRLRGTDLLIVTGGDIFSSEYGSMPLYFEPIRQVSAAGGRVVLLGHSIGPFRRREEAEAFRSIVPKIDLITARESRTRDYLTGELGVPAGKVELTVDTAFLLDPAPPGRVAELRRFYGVDDGPTIALAMSEGISGFVGASGDLHRAAWLRIIPELIDRLGARVLLVPHVQAGSGTNDDRRFATEIVEELGYPEGVRLIGGTHSAAEFKGIIASCDLVIAERMHAAIAGLSTATATLPVRYSVKAEGIMTDLFGEGLRERGLLVDLEELFDASEAARRIDAAWAARAENRAFLAEKLPAVKEGSARNFELLERVVGSRAGSAR